MHSIPRIPGYHLLGRLGGGPMTTVFEARDALTDRPCAIKVLRSDWDDPTTGAKLLQREARAGLGVAHPHLVRVLDAHVLQAPYYLVMELLPGESLRRRLQRDYRLPLVEGLWVVRQCAEALAALHRAGFLHGDIKPENVHIVGDGTARLLDLGFAHRPGENADFLRAGYVMGTASYLAPELCDTPPSENLSSDVFSLGVTFFEMLTGRLPYPAGSLHQTFRRHRTEPPADVRHLLRTLPEPVAQLLERLLAHTPQDRPKAATVAKKIMRMEIAILADRRCAA
jgi:eukaryotic-like serine/threonine-protein kinase